MVTMETVDKKLLQEANEFLTTQNTGFLATNGSAGLRVSPVSIFMGDELKLYIHCFGGDKMTNLSENPEACLLVIEGKDTFDAGIYQGVQVFGRAREIAKGTDDHHKAEIWCPYTHDEDLTLLEFTPNYMVVVDYPDGKKRKRRLELENTAQ